MKHVCAALGLTLITLTACSGGFAPTNGIAQKDTNAAQGFDNLALNIPDGFCLNGKYSERSSEHLFALMHSCNSKATKGFYTLSVRKLSGISGVGGARSIQKAFSDGQGQKVLASSGLKSEVLVEQRTIGRVHFVRTQNTSDPTIPLTQRDVWRGFFVKGGSLFAISFLPLENSKLTSEARFKMVQSYSRRL